MHNRHSVFWRNTEKEVFLRSDPHFPGSFSLFSAIHLYQDGSILVQHLHGIQTFGQDGTVPKEQEVHHCLYIKSSENLFWCSEFLLFQFRHTGRHHSWHGQYSLLAAAHQNHEWFLHSGTCFHICHDDDVFQTVLRTYRRWNYLNQWKIPVQDLPYTDSDLPQVHHLHPVNDMVSLLPHIQIRFFRILFLQVRWYWFLFHQPVSALHPSVHSEDGFLK